jgi:hypothetical protein
MLSPSAIGLIKAEIARLEEARKECNDAGIQRVIEGWIEASSRGDRERFLRVCCCEKAPFPRAMWKGGLVLPKFGAKTERRQTHSFRNPILGPHLGTCDNTYLPCSDLPPSRKVYTNSALLS